MLKYPIEFSAEAVSNSGIKVLWTGRSQEQEMQLSIPPEFNGPGGGLSPEDLFNQALANCFLATFKVYAENSKLNYDQVMVFSKLKVDLDDQKRPMMKECSIVAKIVAPSHPERALLLAKKASESGFILNSVKTHCQFEFQIVERIDGLPVA